MVTGSYKATGEAFKLLPGGMRTGIRLLVLCAQMWRPG